MIGIIDTGICNVRSLQKPLKRLIGSFRFNSKDFMKCERIVLPGVGSWDYAVESLHLRDLWQAIIYHSKVEKNPYWEFALVCSFLLKQVEGTKEGYVSYPAMSERWFQ